MRDFPTLGELQVLHLLCSKSLVMDPIAQFSGYSIHATRKHVRSLKKNGYVHILDADNGRPVWGATAVGRSVAALAVELGIGEV